MYKIKLSLLILIAHVTVSAQSFQGTIKPGTTSTSVICAIKPSGNFTDRVTNLQFTLAVPQTVGARPVLSITSNAYATYFTTIAVFQAATYLTDYIYFINMSVPTLTATRDFIANVEDNVAEFAFAGNVGNLSDIKLVQLPNGMVTAGAGTENGNYNFYVEFAVNGEKTNTTAMFYTNTNGMVVNNPLGYSGFASVSAGFALLPLSWLNMSAQKQNGNALIKWTVANKINADYFEVMISEDGRRFTTAGKVPTTSEDSYSFTDRNISRLRSTYAYYRIKQVDKDGKYSYSEVKKILLTGGDLSIKVVGNPIKGNLLQLGIQAPTDSKGVIRVVDGVGRLLMQQNVTWANGFSVQELRMPPVIGGVYIVQLFDGKQTLQAKFTK